MTEVIGRELVDSAIQRLLEAWAMMLVEPRNGDFSVFDPAMPLVLSQVHYKGPVCGSFTVLVQEPFMRTLTSILLDEEAPSDSLLVDAAKELCNLLSGNLITELFGNDRAFALDAPLVSVSDVADAASKEWPHLHVFVADDCPVAVSFEKTR